MKDLDTKILQHVFEDFLREAEPNLTPDPNDLLGNCAKLMTRHEVPFKTSRELTDDNALKRLGVVTSVRARLESVSKLEYTLEFGYIKDIKNTGMVRQFLDNEFARAHEGLEHPLHIFWRGCENWRYSQFHYWSNSIYRDLSSVIHEYDLGNGPLETVEGQFSVDNDLHIDVLRQMLVKAEARE